MKENDKERGGKRRVKSQEHIYLMMVIYFWLECNCNETISKLSFISLFHSLCPLIAAPPPPPFTPLLIELGQNFVLTLINIKKCPTIFLLSILHHFLVSWMKQYTRTFGTRFHQHFYKETQKSDKNYICWNYSLAPEFLKMFLVHWESSCGGNRLYEFIKSNLLSVNTTQAVQQSSVWLGFSKSGKH